MPDWRRVTRRYPCPVCGGTGWCAVSANGEVCLCMRMESDWPAQKGMGGHLHRLVAELTAPPPSRLVPRGSSLTAAKRGEIGEWILDQLSLEQWHLEHLKGPQRQLRGEQIERRRYRSWPGMEERRVLAKRTLAEFGKVMHGFPGFYVDTEGEPSLVGPQGLFLPVRDTDGNITAFQVRPDTTSHAKRLWLSSAGWRFGTGSGAPPHVSRPGSGRDVATLYVVKGVLNADICSDRLGAVCVGLSGVTNWRSVNWNVLIRQLHAAIVIIALDQDRDEGRVETERVLLADACRNHVTTMVASWNGKLAKGFDDCLNVGLPFSAQ